MTLLDAYAVLDYCKAKCSTVDACEYTEEGSEIGTLLLIVVRNTVAFLKFLLFHVPSVERRGGRHSYP